MELNLSQKWNDFITATQRILTVSKKPDTPQYLTMIRITALGLVVLGVVGYIVELVSFLIRTL